MEPTLKQAGKVIELIAQSGRSTEWVQHLIGSGAFTDILAVDDIRGVHRESHRRFLGLPPLTPPLLEALGTITIPATVRFVAQERFVVGAGSRGRVSISHLGENFREWFLGKIEEPAREMTLRYAKLTRYALDDEIRKEISVAYEETTLAAIWTLLWRQRNGGSGALLTDGRANIFYVRDINGTLRAVRVCWDAGDGGWGVYASSVSYPDRWRGGYRVFSRNS